MSEFATVHNDLMARMPNEKYSATQRSLLLAATAVHGLDLATFLERIGYTHTMAPMIDPTTYRMGLDQLQAIEDLARAAATFQKAVGKFFEAIKR